MMYVLTIESNQAIAQTKEEAKQLLLEKFGEYIDSLMEQPKKDRCENGNVRRIYFNGEIAHHEGSSGWTKKGK